MAVPYGGGLPHALITDQFQQRLSWYMGFALMPMAVPAFLYDDAALIERLWRDWSPDWEPSTEHLDDVRATLVQPGVMAASLAYYRDAFLTRAADQALQDRIGAEAMTVDALLLHGERDGCIGSNIAADEKLFTGRYERHVVPDAGHFLHLEQPEAVFDHINRFLTS